MSLTHYRAVLAKRRLPFWWRCKDLPCPADFSSLPDELLWQLHSELLREIHASISTFQQLANPNRKNSLLTLKLELTRRNYRACTLCPWLCCVDRINGALGRCGLAANARVFREGLLVGEENFVIPTYELFMTGCNMRCSFCQAWEGIVQTRKGILFVQPSFARAIRQNQRRGAINIHFVGGEPTVNLLAILEGLSALDVQMPIVWNTNLYVTDEAMDLLDGIVDLFLADFKFGNDECAQRLAGVPGYVATLRRNLLKASQIASLVVRHLVMPEHLECCLEPVARWVAENIPKVPFNLMLNYVPDWKAWSDPNLRRCLTEKEQKLAKGIAKSYRLKLVS